MGQEAALFAYVIPFMMSTVVGTIFAAVLTETLYKTHAMEYMKQLLEANG